MIRSPTFTRSRRRQMLRGALTISADFGKVARRPTPHRLWGARQMDQLTDIIGWRDAVTFLKPLFRRAEA